MTDQVLDGFQLDTLLTAARQKAGIGDISDDEIIEPLTLLLADYRTTAAFSAQGAQAMQGHLIDCIAMRLRILDTVRQHPEILEEEIKGPLIILGLSRTGTTKLQRVLGASGSFQTLPLWKMMNPLPLPSDAPGTDSRLAVAEQTAAATKQMFPRFYAGHPMVPSEPDEEVLLQESTFASEASSFMAHVPHYLQWLMSHNIESSYRWLKLILQLLQWQDEKVSPKRPWLMKSPVHIARLDEIFAGFPQATMVHCHRDLLTALPSHAALVDAMRGLYSDHVDAKDSGRYTMDIASYGLNAYGEARPRWTAAGKKFMDVQFDEIVRDADQVTARVFDKLALPFTDATRNAIAQWEAANPAGKHGEFRYSLEQYGMSVEDIQTRFAEYIASQRAH